MFMTYIYTCETCVKFLVLDPCSKENVDFYNFVILFRVLCLKLSWHLEVFDKIPVQLVPCCYFF
jgi:hypothetical protein